MHYKILHKHWNAFLTFVLFPSKKSNPNLPKSFASTILCFHLLSAENQSTALILHNTEISIICSLESAEYQLSHPGKTCATLFGVLFCNSLFKLYKSKFTFKTFLRIFLYVKRTMRTYVKIHNFYLIWELHWPLKIIKRTKNTNPLICFFIVFRIFCSLERPW